MECSIMFNPSGSLHSISSPFCRGPPRAHWPLLALAETWQKPGLKFFNAVIRFVPLVNSHPFYSLFSISELKHRSASMLHWYHNVSHNRSALIAHSTCTGPGYLEIIDPEEEIINMMGVFIADIRGPVSGPALRYR